MPFSGFSEDAAVFLGELAQGKDRVWFEAHRAECDRALIEPAKELVQALGPRLRALDPQVQASPKLGGSIKRLERRMRFRASATPQYKEYLDLWFWSGRRRPWDNSGFFLRVTPKRFVLAAGLIEFQKDTLGRYREHVLDGERGPALAAVVSDLRAQGYLVGGESYKRVPRGAAADHPRAALLKHSALFASWDVEHPAQLGSSQLVDYAAGHFARMAALHGWLLGLLA